jgi:hypothetical protein
MKRISIALVSTAFAYVVCAVSGINRWTYIWLKSFYGGYAVSSWIVLAVVLVILSVRLEQARITRLLFGLAAGYLAGIVGYQLAPIVRDGSFVRAASTIQAEGLLSYIGVSLVFPLICLSPLTGLIAMAGTSAVLPRSDGDRYVVVGITALVIIVGWFFFLSCTSVPTKW